MLLLSHPEGLSGLQLAKALYGKPNVQAVKVEVSRLRGIGFEIASRPYRLLNPPAADFLDLKQLIAEGRLREALALYQGPLLPRSFAPGIETLRRELEYELREAVLASQDPNLLYTLAQRLEDDLELWEVVLKTLPSDDPRRPASLAWVCRLRAEYEKLIIWRHRQLSRGNALGVIAGNDLSGLQNQRREHQSGAKQQHG